MKRKFSFLLTGIVATLILATTIGGATYSKKTISPNAEETNSYAVLDESTKVTVSFKYSAITGTEAGATADQYSDTASFNTTYGSNSNASQTLTLSFSHPGNSSITYSTTKTLNADSGTAYAAGATIGTVTSGGTTYTIKAVTAFTFSRAKSSGCSTTYTYTITGTYRFEWTGAIMTNVVTNFGNAVMKTFSLPKNGQLTDATLRRLFEPEASDGYVYHGVYSDAALTTPLTLPVTVSSNATYYVGFYKNTYTDVAYLGKQIHNMSANKTVYLGASGILDPSNDATYFSPTKSFVLVNGGTPINIPSGKTLLFALGGGTFENTFTAKKTDVEPTEANRQYTVVLGEDINLSGTLQIGGTSGNSDASSNSQGMLNGAYVVLDLNGHTINCASGASIDCRGMLIDSAGTGNIVLNGSASLSSLMVIYDTRGGSATSAMADTTFPYNWYHMPYLRCKVTMKHSSGTWGSIVGRFNFRSSGYTTKSVVFNIVGPNASGYLFSVSGDAEDSIAIFEGIHAEALEKAIGGDTQSIARRLRVTFRHTNCQFGYFSVNVGTSVDTRDYTMPITPFMDLRFENSKFTLDKPMCLIPGSSFFGDEDSTMHFTTSTYSSTQLAGGLYVGDRSCVTYDDRISPTVGAVITNHSYKANEGMAAAVSGSQPLAKYYGKGTSTFLGKTYFTTGNTTSYVFSGITNMHNLGTYNASTSTYTNSAKSSLYEQFVDVVSKGANITTYGHSWMVGQKYETYSFSMPLISFDEAFIIDSSRSLHGHYDDANGVFYNHLDSGVMEPYILASSSNTVYSPTGLTPMACTVVEGESSDYYQYVTGSNGYNYYFFSGSHLLSSSSNTATPAKDGGVWKVTLNTSRFESSTTLAVKWVNASQSHRPGGYWARAS